MLVDSPPSLHAKFIAVAGVPLQFCLSLDLASSLKWSGGRTRRACGRSETKPTSKNGAKERQGQGQGTGAEAATLGETYDRDATAQKGGRSAQSSLLEGDGRHAVHCGGHGEPTLNLQAANLLLLGELLLPDHFVLFRGTGF